MPLHLKLNPVLVFAIAAVGVALGNWLRRRIPLLARLSIPASVAGGLVYAALLLLLRDRWANFEIDTVLRDLFMVAFFTAIGMNASWKVVRAGGVQVLLFLALATAGAVLQNALGIGLAKLLGVNPLLGIVSGAVALAGGPATSAAFGATFEKLGLPGAATLGLASATFGILAAGVLSGFAGARYARRTPRPSAAPSREGHAVAAAAGPLLPQVTAMAVAMGAGWLVSAAIERTGVVLPGYIGAMIAAAVLRNADDRWHFARIDPQQVASLGNIALSLFIVMALLTLKLWELVHLALPLLTMLLAQVALAWAMCVAVFRLMGRDYEAAVMTGGYCGFMLGTTANAMAAMDEIERQHGPAPRAFIVVPLVGGFLIDFTNALVITASANLLPR
jgi:glutamate:Na+ symporter, ESS family